MTDKPFWSDDFDMDLPKIVPEARDLLGDHSRVAVPDVRKIPEIKMRADALMEERRGHKRLPAYWDIDKAVCGAYGISMADLATNRRHQPAAEARQVAMYLCRQLTGRSLPQIARDHGKKDHTTVMYACRVIEERIRDEPAFGARVDGIARALLGAR